MRMNMGKSRGVSAYGIVVLILLLFFLLVAVPRYKFLSRSISKVACGHKKGILSRALETCFNDETAEVQPPYKAVDQQKLGQLNHLSVRVECGSGGVLKVDKSQRVYCTYHNPRNDW